MLDKIEIKIYVKHRFLKFLHSGGAYVPFEYFPSNYATKADVFREGLDSQITIVNERTHWETINSGLSGMAMWFNYSTQPPPNRENFDFPHVVIKYSPSKLTQGHNAYSLVGMRDGLKHGIALLIKSYPYFAEILDFSRINWGSMDINKTAFMKSVEQKALALEMLGNINIGQRKVAETYIGGVKFNKGVSRGIIYDKDREVNTEGQRKSKAAIEAEGNSEFCKNMLRFEYKVRHEKLAALGYPVDVNQWLLQSDEQINIWLDELWYQFFEPILTAIEGASMKILDDDFILEKLRAAYVYYHHKTGAPIYSKADRLFGFYKTIVNVGYKGIDWSISRNKRARKDLFEAGIPPIHIMNMAAGKAQTKVIQLKDICQISFSDRVPENYVYPKIASF